MNERLERVLTWVLALALVASVMGVVYVAVSPPETTEPYTEFYMLGTEGNASGYPTNLSAGESGTLVLGISNHEHRDVTYSVVVSWDNETTQAFAVEVPDEETIEREVAIQAPEDVDGASEMKVHFRLYKGSGVRESVTMGERPPAEPYRWLRLLVDLSG